MLVIYSVNIPDLTTGVKLKLINVGFEKNGIEELGSHEEILHRKIVAYSSPSDFFVNWWVKYSGQRARISREKS